MGAIYRLTENEDRAIIWQTDRQTDRQTDKVSLSFSAAYNFIMLFQGRVASTVFVDVTRPFFALRTVNFKKGNESKETIFKPASLRRYVVLPLSAGDLCRGRGGGRFV